MPLDLFMNDTCPQCRKPLKPATIEQHLTRRNLEVHKFGCTNCGAVQTKILLRKDKPLPGTTHNSLLNVMRRDPPQIRH